MKFSADDFKQIYSEMPDEELRSLDRQELSEVAQQCYDAELARRGLEAKAARRTVQPAEVADEAVEIASESEDASEESVAQQEEEDLAPAALFASRDEAMAARLLLQSADLPAFLENDTLGGGGFRVLVVASDVERAHEVLRAELSD